ncbi:MAG: hypothetical protein KAU94_11715 [Verrucomicrobia bacterium]|nr:hypothetical protein [Verrucomicrobiota bacterium]
MKTLVPKHIAAVSMMVVAAAARTGMADQNDGSTATQDDRRENIITQSTLSKFRVFTTTNDKPVKARVRAYYPDKGIVAIAKESGKTHRVDLNTLSKDDQDYVREWHRIKDFFSQDRFHISVRKKRSGAGAEYLFCRFEVEIVYAIMLENRSDYDLEGLSVDYCIYHGQEELNYWGQVMSQGVKSGTRNIGTLARGEKVQFETQPALFPRSDGFEYYQVDKEPRGEILGIWIRTYLPLESGHNAMRELSFPSSLMKTRKWIAPDAPSSQNNWKENQQ